MTRSIHATQTRRWWVPEMVQTSAMDCGPAALTCLLQGFHIPASYGRLREACQTDVDGTSIDVVETVARQLGLDAEQIMLPPDDLWLPETKALPTLVVVQQASGLLHFVIVWRRVGRWLQLMDPAVGRRWVSCDRFARQLHLHSLPVEATEWYTWATSDEAIDILAARLRRLGATTTDAVQQIQQVKDQGTWQALAQLDAAARMIERLTTFGGLRRGVQAVRLLERFIAQAKQYSPGACPAVPDAYWSVVPANTQGDVSRVILRGAVLLRIRGRLPEIHPSTANGEIKTGLAPELAAALNEQPVRPLRELLLLMRGEGVLTPLALLGAIGLGIGAVLIESILFRGLFELATVFTVASQRLFAVGALLSFLVLLWACELPILSESLRLGRHLETRLRVALLQKLPTLHDRYLHSRPISDMAERSHSLALVRGLPALAVHLVQSCWEVLFTLVGIGLIAPHSLPLAATLVGLSLGLAVVAQQPMREGDLRLRGHAAALYGFSLDALRGSAPIQTHSAERSVRREHEGLLTEWARASRRLLNLSLLVQGSLSLIAAVLIGVLILQHLYLVGVTGSLLLLVYWALKLPALGKGLATMALQYPAHRNIVMRLLEPLNAPSDTAAGSDLALLESSKDRAGESGMTSAVRPLTGVEIELCGVTVVAAGHTILHNITLRVRQGEHLAIVGPSGAGKSSVLGLLLGWHRAAAGSVLVDGQPLSEAKVRALRRETAWVDPAIQLWNRSLLENVSYSHKTGRLSDLGSLLERTDLTQMIARLPDGLQSPLGEGGAQLSGGEGQRVRLARAMWQAAARLVLLDEPFRGLDRAERHRHLVQARASWKEATLLCVTHDVAETQAFDRVVVIENGGIVEDGLPEQLAAMPTSRYRALLDAEKTARHELWAGAQWRHLRLNRGQVQEMGVPNEITSTWTSRSAVGSEVGDHA